MLPGEYLVVGQNEVQVDFTADFVKNCQGMHHFQDTDGCEYVYTESEPNHAHIWFPCFDQPDMKAKLDLYIMAPEDWSVLSNQPETKSTEVNAQIESFFNVTNMMRDQFTEGKYINFKYESGLPISTYLFCIVAGPFAVVEQSDASK